MLALLLGFGLSVQEQTPPAPDIAVLEDIAVTGSRELPLPYDVVADFVTYCYDANRLGGRSRSPEGVGLWGALDPAEASRLGVPVTGQAYILDSQRIKLVLLVEEGRGSQNRQQHNCTLIAVGRHDPKVIEADLARLMGRGGASMYLARSDLFTTFDGWKQIGWSAIPRRGSTDWRVFGEHPESFVVAVEPYFYGRSNWVVTEFRSREDEGIPTTAIKLTYFFSP